MNKKALFALTAVFCSGTLLYAEETTEKAVQESSPWELSVTTSGAYYPEVGHDRGSTHITGISGPYDGIEAATEFDATYTLPFLNGDDELTADNHLAFKLGLELTPVTVAPVASVTFSPIAFLEFAICGTA